MTGTSQRFPAGSSAPPLHGSWRALLRWASRPLWEEGPSPPRPPLWVGPAGAPGKESAAYPHEEAIRRLLSRYAALLGVPFSFRTGVGRYSPPAPPDAIHVHAYALPTPATFFGIWPRVPLSPLQFAYGVPLREGAHWTLTPGTHMGRGHFLADREGCILAEYRGTNLYCLFDLLEQEAVWVPLLLRRHLDLGLPHVISALAVGPAGPAEAWRDRLELLREETDAEVHAGRQTRHRLAREAYVSACREGVADEMRFLRADIAFLEAGVEEMGRRISADTRRLIEGRRRLRALQDGQAAPEPPAPEHEGLQALPEVREARVGDGCISVRTHPLFTEYEGRRYRLGAFQLDLYANGDVRISNLSDRVGLFDHPRVFQGRPRLSGIREGVAKLLGESQFAAAVEVLIDFLKTMDPTDWQLPVQSWPEVGPEAERGVLATA